MNKYNLKKGDILKSKDGDERKILGICGDVYFLSKADEFKNASNSIWSIKDLEEHFIELTRYQEKWKPEKGEKYWFIDGSRIDCALWYDDAIDNGRLNGLGVYPTKELAEDAFNKAKKAINE